MKLTKAQWAELGVRNSHEVASRGTKRYVSYRPAEYGRASNSAAWQVVHIGYLTDPKGHWRDNGHKTFTVYRREEKEAKLKEAIAWASKRYGIKEWERDPWGDWHPAGTLVMAKDYKRPEASNG